MEKLTAPVNLTDYAYSLQALIQGLSLYNKVSQYATPLHAAICNDKIAYAYKLCQSAEYKKYIITQDQSGNTPLHLGVIYHPNNSQLAQMLINRGADCNKENHRGATPLHQAAALGDTALVRLLLDQGAKREIEDKKGSTALDYTNHFPDRTAVRDLLTPNSATQERHLFSLQNCSLSFFSCSDTKPQSPTYTGPSII